MPEIRKNQPGKKFFPYWRTCVGAGRANEGLRASFQQQLQLLQKEIGFRYLRFHGLFHDDMFVMRSTSNGQFIFNFQYIDDLFDAMLEANIRPFVELGFFPECIRGGDATQFFWKAHVTPPKQYDSWCLLIQRFVEHLLDRYGHDEVRTWYFEVWNEPNLDGFWDGTKTQYFELYRETVQTIKQIDSSLRVGGPATSNFVPDARFDGETENVSVQITHQTPDLSSLSWRGVWIEDFLRYCSENHLPVDFVSTHPYPTDFAFDANGKVSGRTRDIDALFKDLHWLKNTIQNSAYPNAEIHLTEWSSSPTSRDCTHDYLQEAAFIVKCNLDCIGLADSLSYWTFTDVFEELGAGDSIFHGGFGLINYQGIVKPGFHAYRMLTTLGDLCLYKDEHIFVTNNNGRMVGLAYHYPVQHSISMSIYPNRSIAEKELNAGETIRIPLHLTALNPHQNIRFEILNRQNGWALPKWQQMGCPEPPNREQTQVLREAAQETKRWFVAANANGELKTTLEMEPWSILLFEEA